MQVITVIKKITHISDVVLFSIASICNFIFQNYCAEPILLHFWSFFNPPFTQTAVLLGTKKFTKYIG